MPGFYLENPPRFFEVKNAEIDTGNNAWTMIALLALYKQFSVTNYLAADRRIGEFIQTMLWNADLFPGFRGGIQGAEATTPRLRKYASTEQSLDTYAAFRSVSVHRRDAMAVGCLTGAWVHRTDVG